MKLTCIFDTLKNMYPTEYDMNSICNLFTGPHKGIQIYYELWLEIAEGAFQVVLFNF